MFLDAECVFNVLRKAEIISATEQQRCAELCKRKNSSRLYCETFKDSFNGSLSFHIEDGVITLFEAIRDQMEELYNVSFAEC